MSQHLGGLDASNLLPQRLRREHLRFRAPAQHPQFDLAGAGHLGLEEERAVLAGGDLLGGVPGFLEDVTGDVRGEQDLHPDGVSLENTEARRQEALGVEIGRSGECVPGRLEGSDAVDGEDEYALFQVAAADQVEGAVVKPQGEGVHAPPGDLVAARILQKPSIDGALKTASISQAPVCLSQKPTHQPIDNIVFNSSIDNA